MYKRCGNCRGSKVIIGLGMLQKTCPHCKGSGYADECDETIVPEKVEEPIVKRRGRKPKLKDEVVFDGHFS